MTESNKIIKENFENIRQRRNDLDALRVLATILLIYFHTAMFFSLSILLEIHNEQLSVEMAIFVFFCHIWHMPLFFFLAGMGTYYSLIFRTDKEYVKERIKRLFIPFFLGILIVVPPMMYLYRLPSWHEPNWFLFNSYGSYFNFYPHFFERGNFTWFHLWFLLYLLFISIVSLPILKNFKMKNRKQHISSTMKYFENGKNIFLLSLPLILINVSLRWIFPGYYNFFNDWAQILGYFAIFIFGFLIVGNIRFEKSIDQNKRLALILAIISSFIVTLMFKASIIESNTSSKSSISIGYVVFWSLFSFCEWCWLITIFGYGMKYLNKNNPLLSHLSEISLPFYILHLPIIIIIGFYIIQWEATILVKFLIITTISMFITIFLSELVKTNNITRFMFGMKPKQKNK